MLKGEAISISAIHTAQYTNRPTAAQRCALIRSKGTSRAAIEAQPLAPLKTGCASGPSRCSSVATEA